MLPPPNIAELAIDCDYAMLARFNGDEAALIQWVNGDLMPPVKVEYLRDLNIDLQVTHILVRTSGTITLPQCRAEWNANHSDIPHDLVLLLLGNNNNDPGIWGGAWRIGCVGTIDCFCACYPFKAEPYGINIEANLVAHELGHVCGAPHDVYAFNFTMQSGTAPYSPFPLVTQQVWDGPPPMPPDPLKVGALNQFSPMESIPAITSYKATLHCLDIVGPPIYADTTPPTITNFAIKVKGRFISVTVNVTDNYSVKSFDLYMDGSLFMFGGADWSSLKLPDNRHHDFMVRAVDQDNNVAWSNVIGVH